MAAGGLKDGQDGRLGDFAGHALATDGVDKHEHAAERRRDWDGSQKVTAGGS